jgi:hypothetical protein
LFIQKSIKNEKAEKSGTAEKRRKSGRGGNPEQKTDLCRRGKIFFFHFIILNKRSIQTIVKSKILDHLVLPDEKYQLKQV